MGFNKNEIIAYEKGYRATKEGTILGLKGVRKIIKDRSGYAIITISINGKSKHIRCHRLQAYQKFGDNIFTEGTLVRHLDGDKLNFSWDNIEIGTQSQNMMDRDPSARLEHSRLAAKAQRRFTDDIIKDIRKLKSNGYSLGQLSKLFKTSKGHLSDIVNRKIYSDVT